MHAFLMSRAKSFRHAFDGSLHVIKNERNAWIHVAMTACVVTVAAFLQIPPRDWAAVVLAIGMVWVAETMNTAIERVVDLASPSQHPLAKAGKDVAAAAVLMSAGFAIVIGLLILGPPILERVQDTVQSAGH
jgi:diacylglycerol kinase